ncbi:bifunctional adenosylcobinamide kinase/adenosylcobinamide-phosphate guanylyltransferase [Streptomyces sp. AV19]|uniref:bifunctional adenosylcobinamide kinase/adenosylcobinamide-phosphate guanylyltransferase n=1 Tax=Streptomyces sp. AV19 TaxID=2793068 RepID=UPI0018FE3475|nr:bifunctional adenosylcobinamide kinase/adenosylcobinamide-phosphate guanylyltransferase [Streptomyces sp. AV19]MBH1933556.1 bifunctional adenosylcobinamide kinase/adenosylcobinamide-phosphate guanylyltransferase [Streptomyces sp. AV19]MDG4532210.1 bifunctional adenosylcobinamide kinase/adenosylcobinamide-phosphate guanylyltransferase [Streptomyces sp. AV19]
MELTLLGTGAPDGLPRPGCPCAACATAVGEDARAATALLVDGALLFDLTPGPAFAAARAGRSISGVRQVLLSHPHDGPAVEFPAGLPAPGRVPDGRELSVISGHRVRAVALDAPGTGYEVTGPDGDRLLYLPPGGAPAGLSPSPSPSPYDVVLLDVAGRPDALARLRETGAVTATTDVLAVHLDHDVPPGLELHRRLAAAGARAVPDGTSVTVGDYHAVPDVPRRALVLGGARSGKSVEAERRLESFPDVLYVATGGTRDGDGDWAARVALHRERRPASWRTAETCDLVPLLTSDGPPLLIDCLALWLTHAMDSVGAWDDERWANGGAAALAERVAGLVAAVRATRRTVVAVSNEVGSGVVPATASGRRFRDELGRLNAGVAGECEQVVLVVAGQAVRLRG